jgi:hypothetical protein
MEPTKEDGWAGNAAFVFGLFVLGLARGIGGAAPILAVLIAIAGVAWSVWGAATDRPNQKVSGPIMTVLMVAVMIAIPGQSAPWLFFYFALLAVSLGCSVLAGMLDQPKPVMVMILGPVLGVLGVAISIALIKAHVPVFSTFVAPGDIPDLNVFHIQMHSDLDGHGQSSFAGIAFLVQSVAAAAWDALLLSAGVLALALTGRVVVPARA